jgi:hypothetical protein
MSEEIGESLEEVLDALESMYVQYCTDGHDFMSAGEQAVSVLHTFGKLQEYYIRTDGSLREQRGALAPKSRLDSSSSDVQAREASELTDCVYARTAEVACELGTCIICDSDRSDDYLTNDFHGPQPDPAKVDRAVARMKAHEACSWCEKARKILKTSQLHRNLP